MGDPGVPMSSGNLVEVPPGNASGATHIYMNAACGGGNGASCPAVGAGYGVAISLYAAGYHARRRRAPDASNLGGSLAAGGTLSGVGDISFSAADTGSGLYEAVFSIDGHAVSTQLLQSGSGPCRSVGGTSGGGNAFFEVQPCPLELSDDLSFDTALDPDQVAPAERPVARRGRERDDDPQPPGDVRQPRRGPPGGGIGPGSPLALRGAANGLNASDQAVLTARWKSTAKAVRTGGYGAKEEITGRLTAPGGVWISPVRRSACMTHPRMRARGPYPSPDAPGPTGAWTLTLPKGVSSMRYTTNTTATSTTQSPSPRPLSRCAYTPGSRCGSRPARRVSIRRSSSAARCTARRSRRAASSSCWRRTRAENRSIPHDHDRREGALPRVLPLQVPRPHHLPLPRPLTLQGGLPVPRRDLERRRRARALSDPMRYLSMVVMSLLSGICLMCAPAARAASGRRSIVPSRTASPRRSKAGLETSVGGLSAYSSVNNNCGQQGGSVLAANSSQFTVPRSTGPMWEYAAPSGSTIAGGSITVSLTAPQGQAYLATPSNETNGANILANCQFNLPCGSNTFYSAVVPIEHLGGTRLYAGAMCVGPGQPGSSTGDCAAGDGANGLNAQTIVYAADVELANSSTPVGRTSPARCWRPMRAGPPI